MKLFGTSGIRGKYNNELNSTFAFNLGKVIAIMFQKKNMRVVVGIDNRLSSKILEKALVCGLNSVGADAFLIGETITPCVSYAVNVLKADLGVMITGSHKKENHNGFKIFNGNGYKITDEEESFIENAIENSDDILEVNEEELGKTYVRKDILDSYVNYVGSMLDNIVQNFNILIDTAGGTTYEILKKIENVSKIKFSFVEDKSLNRYGTNDITLLKEGLIKGNYNFGVAFDGDGDRVLFLDSKGNLIDTDFIASILIEHYGFNKVVLNLFSNEAFIEYNEKLKKECYISNVGEKYITEKMLENNIDFGFEKVGHYIFNDIINTSDGILAFIKLLNCYALDKEVFDKFKDFKMYYNLFENIETNKITKIIQDKELIDLIHICESLLLENGKVLVRASQIESSIRVYVESSDKNLVDEIFEKIIVKIKSI